jgi:hypothetical protein
LNDQRFSSTSTSDPVCSRSFHAKHWPAFGRKNTARFARLADRRSAKQVATMNERQVFPPPLTVEEIDPSLAGLKRLGVGPT